MCPQENPIGDLVDEAVVHLTRLAQHFTQNPPGTFGPEGFGDRLADILTHVAANVGGPGALLADSDPPMAAQVYALIEARAEPDNLLWWRTRPIVVQPQVADVVIDAALAPFDARIAHLEATYEAACAGLLQAHHQRAPLTALGGQHHPGPTQPQPLSSGSTQTSPGTDSEASTAVHHREIEAMAFTLTAARAAREGARTTYRSAVLNVMNTCAADLGYEAPVIYARDATEVDPADEQLVEYLQNEAIDRAPRPHF